MHISRAKYLGYFVATFLILFLDLSIKQWSETQFLQESDAQDIRNYRSTKHTIFVLGAAAKNTLQETNPLARETGNWFAFDLTYLRNPGVVWGLFSDLSGRYRTIFLSSLTLSAIVFVLFLFFKTRTTEFLKRLGLAFILGGAFGNFFDRILDGYVTDMFHFSWNIWSWGYSFPVFNFADIAINIGVAMLVFESVTNRKRL